MSTANLTLACFEFEKRLSALRSEAPNSVCNDIDEHWRIVREKTFDLVQKVHGPSGGKAVQ